MISRSALFVLFSTAVVLMMALPSYDAFSATQPGRSIQPARYQPKSSKGRSSDLLLASILKMSPNQDEEAAKSKIAVDGTFYDDEIDTAPIKTGISDSMKAKLMAEASTGLDSEKPQTNTILYISVVVVILVALAGGGILY